MHIVGALKGLAAPLQVYWLDVLIVLAGIAAVIWLWRKGRIDIIKRLIRVMVVQAEKQYGSGTGRIKFEAVLTAVYEKMPALLRLLIPKKKIIEWIEEAVQWLKKQLTDGKTNLLDLATEVTLAAGPAAIPDPVIPESSERDILGNSSPPSD
ncbi:MAG: hypothetical protein GXX08_12330 [Firmicutes bacterium]|nr:hypothetical protein [Bacillota bacterium]